MVGKVYLIGAGPGDEGLITVKGLNIIKEADVILYDRLANPRLLDYAREGVELFYVGKKASNHYRTQDEINQLLVEQAQAGNIVARLKGGDPFVFGRGGEEAEVLLGKGIEFEVVPGITSPISVAAYAGIPLTHRDFNSSVGFVTGHEDPTKDESNLNWDQLANAMGTLVFLMGVGNLAKITKRLMEAGCNRETPVALVRWGTRPEQETLVGTLETIVTKVEKNNLKPPAIIVIGEVINLREKLNWFETKALFSKRIVVTRPKKQATSFSKALARDGAKVIEAPAIKIVPPESYQELDQKLEQVGDYDWIIFTSINGVKYFINRLFELGLDVRALAGVKLCAIGPKTAAKLNDYGLQVDYIPDDYVIESILEGFVEEDLTGQKFLLPRADIARELLAHELENNGAKVDDVTAYQTIKGVGSQDLITELEESRVDMVTFTSSSTVHNFIEQLGDEYQRLLADIELACIGPITAQTVRDYELEIAVVADEYTVEGLLAAVKGYYKNN
ncbi:uroporphyrinogen-III C-methyltransferase [Natroniella sp. ANB-PHB2]|uniref:uroporphyrinogen-III C-methyltransferase n=1 Tax=Natroniella sp. ANB-PHB2 TaxID=3384444 RepID=UPI0038D42016